MSNVFDFMHRASKPNLINLHSDLNLTGSAN